MEDTCDESFDASLLPLQLCFNSRLIFKICVFYPQLIEAFTRSKQHLDTHAQPDQRALGVYRGRRGILGAIGGHLQEDIERPGREGGWQRRQAAT